MRSMTLGRVPGRMFALALVGASLAAATRPSGAGADPDSGGWTAGAPRDEIRPEFACETGDGPGCPTTLVIRAGRRDGVDGYWTKAFPVTGGRHYRLRWAAVADQVLPARNAARRATQIILGSPADSICTDCFVDQKASALMTSPPARVASFWYTPGPR